MRLPLASRSALATRSLRAFRPPARALRPKLAAGCTGLVLSLWAAAPAAGAPAGFDLFETDPQQTVFRFGGDLAIPAAFFAPGSQPFQGIILLGGEEIGKFQNKPVGDTDTIVRRMNAAEVPSPGTMDTIPIELVALSLVSVAPITVTYNGKPSEMWDVRATLSPTRMSTGDMTINRTSPQGGTFDSFFAVNPLFTFTRLSDGQKKTLDIGQVPLSPVQRQKITLRAKGTPWVDDCPPAALTVGGLNDQFCPSADRDEKKLTAEQALAAHHGIRPAQPRVEHFKCYGVRGQRRFKRRNVQLADQFVQERARVLRPVELCNPVQKNDEELQNKVAHLKCYAIKARRFRRQDVYVRNQFGPDRLTVRKQRLLCLPTVKRVGLRRRPALKLDPQQLTDHFKCYDARSRTRFQTRRVRLEDQFHVERARVLRPFRLCAPVQKNNERVQHPVKHLVCYRIVDRRRFRQRFVQTLNQFGKEVLRVIKPQTLCVPSLKVPVKQPPPPPPLDRDGDGIPDGFDLCADAFAPESNDGCPRFDGTGQGQFFAGNPNEVFFNIQFTQATTGFAVQVPGNRQIDGSRSRAGMGAATFPCQVEMMNSTNDTFRCTADLPASSQAQGQLFMSPEPTMNMGGSLFGYQGQARGGPFTITGP